MSTVATFICGPGDGLWLPGKLMALTTVCQRVCVVLDRCPEYGEIRRRFGAEFRLVDSDPADLSFGYDGPRWSEGKLRQAAWDFAMECDPEFVLLGDADEIPAPAIADYRMPDGVDVVYADWVNLVHDAAHAIGGRSAWSYQVPSNNKKGLLVRVVPGRGYRYRLGTRHVRMEPSPLQEAGTGYDETHRLGPVPLVHYRWAAWDRWLASDHAELPAYRPWPPADAEIVPVDPAWLWRWVADEMIGLLPAPIAVVGNGPITGKAAEIDAHPTVIRLNNFSTDAEHRGQKTTAWCSNCWDDVAMRPWTGELLTVVTEAEQPDRIARWRGTYPHLRVPRTSWTESARAIKSHNPSTGLTLLYRLAQGRKPVRAYGFTGLLPGGDSPRADQHGTETEALRQLGGRIEFR